MELTRTSPTSWSTAETGPLGGARFEVTGAKSPPGFDWRQTERARVHDLESGDAITVWTDAPDWNALGAGRDPRRQLEAYVGAEILARTLEQRNTLPLLSAPAQRWIEALRGDRLAGRWPRRVKKWPDGEWIELTEHTWRLPRDADIVTKGRRSHYVIEQPGGLECLRAAMEEGARFAEPITLTEWNAELSGHGWYDALPIVRALGLTPAIRRRIERETGVIRAKRIPIRIEARQGYSDGEPALKARINVDRWMLTARAIVARENAVVSTENTQRLMRATLHARYQRHGGLSTHEYGEDAAWAATMALIHTEPGDTETSALATDLARRVEHAVPKGYAIEISVRREDRSATDGTGQPEYNAEAPDRATTT